MKLAIITGGSKGLGEALVSLYSENEWEVKELSRSGTTRHHIDCDFSNAIESASVINDTFIELSHHDWSEIILINNVGTLCPIGPINFDTPEEWHQNIQINFNSCVTTTGLFLKHFCKTTANRCIANISSGAAIKPYFGWSLYCASKAAMEAFTRCVALEQSLTTNPVAIFIINPGVIDTDMQSLIRSQDKTRFNDLDRFKRLKAEESLQTPAKVAKAVYSIIESSPVAGEKYDLSSHS